MEQDNANVQTIQETKFCKHCGGKIAKEAVICTLCGCQVEDFQQAQPNIIINNANSNFNNNVAENVKKLKNKWLSFFLCLFFGYWGVHKFYEGKILLGIVYFFTCGLFFIGWFVDIIRLLFKPNPYTV